MGVRNATKAREVLGCIKCDESEGIYVGDVTKPETLEKVMTGAAGLVILTSAVPICTKIPDCHYAPGASPKEVDWIGGRNQIEAFAKYKDPTYYRMITLVSTM